MTGRDADDLPLARPLTPREQDILDCIGAELTNRQMAERLTLALGTVKWYVRQVYNKLGVSNRNEAIARAQRLGLLPDEQHQDTVRHNLPADATPFVGRERELTELAGLIADLEVRLITIVGPGGIGKTRLALEAARRTLSRETQFSDGIWFVPLAPLESADEIWVSMATALDLQLLGSEDETLQFLRNLKQKKMLVVFDNFDHVMDGRPFLDAIARQTDGIRLLITSRERLQMHGEQLYPLQGLEIPQAGHLDENEISSFPAAKLFLNTARRTVPDFNLLEGDEEHLLDLCQMAGGMPLALELAASWVGLLPLAEIAAEIRQSLSLLVTQHRNVPQRHRSMETALDVSWGRLSSEQQEVFQAVAIFRGGFTRPAALEVAGATLPLLVTLVNKSWLSYNRQTDRYHIHELLRQYGIEKLSVRKDFQHGKYQKHADYFARLIQQSADIRYTKTDWFEQVLGEIDNLRLALASIIEKGDLSLAADLCKILEWFWFAKGHISEGRRWFGKVLSSGSADSLPLDDRAVLCRMAGYFAWFQGDNQSAMMLFQLSLELYQKLDNPAGIADLIVNLGMVAEQQGDFQQAQDMFAKSLCIRQELGDKYLVADSLYHIGVLNLYQSNFKEAQTNLSASLALFQSEKGVGMVQIVMHMLGFAELYLGEIEQAAERFREALILKRRQGAMFTAPFPLLGVASVLSARQQLEGAARIIGAAESLKQNTGLRLGPVFRRVILEPIISDLHDQLDEKTYHRMWTEGQHLTGEEAVDLALAEIDRLEKD